MLNQVPTGIMSISSQKNQSLKSKDGSKQWITEIGFYMMLVCALGKVYGFNTERNVRKILIINLVSRVKTDRCREHVSLMC